MRDKSFGDNDPVLCAVDGSRVFSGRLVFTRNAGESVDSGIHGERGRRFRSARLTFHATATDPTTTAAATVNRPTAAAATTAAATAEWGVAETTAAATTARVAGVFLRGRKKRSESSRFRGQ